MSSNGIAREGVNIAGSSAIHEAFLIDFVPNRNLEECTRPVLRFTPETAARTFREVRCELSASKRAFDVFAASLALVLLSPVLLVLAICVKMDSPGPVLFSHVRLGLHGRRFRMYKFRTMRSGADLEKDAMAHLNQSDDSRLFKIPSDPRVTRVGQSLRRWSLDELPQLYNVLRGDMSLVGPRPFFEEDLGNYQTHHFERLLARPGLTGLWQVSGRSDILDFEEVVRLDRHYIDNWSMGFDLRIIGRTLPVVIQRRGAY